MSQILDVARYFERHDGEIVSINTIANSLGLSTSSISRAVYALIHQGAPIKRLAKGAFMYEKTKKEVITEAMREHPGEAMTITEIAEATGLPRTNVGWNVPHYARDDDSPIQRVAEGMYAYNPEKPKQEEPTEPIPGIRLGEKVETPLLFEKVETLDNSSVLLKDEQGNYYRAEKLQPERATVVRVGDHIHVIKD